MHNTDNILDCCLHCKKFGIKLNPILITLDTSCTDGNTSLSRLELLCDSCLYERNKLLKAIFGEE